MCARLIFPQQLRQLGDVGRNPPRLVAGEQLARGAPTGLILTIDEGQRLLVGVAHDETGRGFFDGPRRREAAFSTDRHACR
jgi:hypothetical protein